MRINFAKICFIISLTPRFSVLLPTDWAALASHMVFGRLREITVNWACDDCVFFGAYVCFFMIFVSKVVYFI